MIVTVADGADAAQVQRALIAKGLWVKPLRTEGTAPRQFVVEPFSARVERAEVLAIAGVAGVSVTASEHPLVDAQPPVVEVAGARIGVGAEPVFMAGPCSVESLEQIERIARIDGELYLATRNGLKRLQAGARPGMPARFGDDRVRRTSTWDLLASAHGTLVATGAGVWLLPRDPKAAAVELFASARVSALVPAADDWIYAVATNEIRRLRWRGQAFEVDPEALRLVPMFDAVWHDGALWASIDGGGVFRMAALERWPTPAIARFGVSEGVADGQEWEVITDATDAAWNEREEVVKQRFRPIGYAAYRATADEWRHKTT